MTYTIGMRSFGKEDLVKSFKGQPEETTISRNEMQNYVLDGITVTPVINDNKAVIDFSNVRLPWKFEYSDKMLTSRFAIAPYGTTVTQPKYVKELNGTIIGSPTVDENHVVTNFSNSQYISTTPFTFNDATDTFKVDTYVKLSSLPSYTFIFTASSTSRGAATQSSTWKTNSSNGNQTGGSVATNRWYHLVLEQTGNSSVLYVDGQAIINAGKCFNSGDYINFGKSNWEPFYNGFIDFSQTSIQINGEEVWSGTKWVDRVLNVNKVGSPTVDEDFIASGFNKSSWLNIPYEFPTSYNRLEFFSKFNTGTLGSAAYPIICQTGANKDIFINGADKKIAVFDGANVYTGTTTLQNNTNYMLKATVESGVTKVYINDTLELSVSTNIFNVSKFSLGVCPVITSIIFSGSIDLKETYLKVNDTEVYRGVEDLGTETLSGCVRYYFGYKPNATTPPEDSSNTYNIYAVNGDEGIVLDSKWYYSGGLTTRPVLGDGPIPDFEKEWYLGEYRVETGEEGSPYSPDSDYFNPLPGGGIVLS